LATAAAKSAVTTPGSTTAYRSATLISMIRVSAVVTITTVFEVSGMMPPERLVPEPRTVMGMPLS
jgi:hypothetical protein